MSAQETNSVPTVTDAPAENVSLNVDSENAEATAPAQPPSLTVGVLTQVRNILDALIARGAVRPNEMSAVGQVYDQYSAGLNHLIQMSQAADERQSSENTSA